MKTLLVILCSLGLALAQFTAAQPAPAAPVHPCRHCGGKMSCCARQSSPAAPAAPASSSRIRLPNQLLTPLPGASVWRLSPAEADPFSSAALTLPAIAEVPLFARFCVRLI